MCNYQNDGLWADKNKRHQLSITINNTNWTITMLSLLNF